VWRRIRRLNLVAPLLAVVLVSLVSWRGIDLLSQPRELIRVEPSAKFACDAREGEVVTAPFTVRNISSSPVRVMGAEATCGCMVAQGLPISLGPGEVGKISLRVVVGPPGADGVFARTTHLFIDRDGPSPPLVVEVKSLPKGA